MSILFYRKSNHIKKNVIITNNDNYEVFFWQPKKLWEIPNGLSNYPFLIWNFFYFFKIFKSKNYGVLIIRKNNEIIHHSTLTPSFFRFPDMRKNDVQIGNTFTSPKFRGKGLATIAIQNILINLPLDYDLNVWYLVEDSNFSSVKVIEYFSFDCVGKGDKEKSIIPFLFDKYKIR